MNNKPKVSLISLGCPKNLIDSEIAMGLLAENGYLCEPNIDNADVIIVNTCAFIESAKQEAIVNILEACEYKNNHCKAVIVMGCLAERYKEEIIDQIPEVDAIVGTCNIKHIVDTINNILNNKNQNNVLYGFDDTEYIEGIMLTNEGIPYSYLRIAEGCSNFCTYCIIPKLRGPYRSRSIENIKNEAIELAQKGCKELILVAQDVTMYGTDIYGEKRLVQLIQELSTIEDVFWIRLLYCYPDEFDDNLINEIANNNKVLNYVDLPIQHISDKVLKSMGRRGSSKQIKELLEKLRKNVPDVSIRTSLITGFPGESEDDFNELLEFVKEIKFDRLGVFSYSKEEDTPAYKLKNQINMSVKEKRRELIMLAQQEISIELNQKKVGNIYKTIVEGVAEDGIFYYGRTYAEAPEIDSLLYFTSEEPLAIGDFVDVKILNIDGYDLVGAVVQGGEG